MIPHNVIFWQFLPLIFTLLLFLIFLLLVLFLLFLYSPCLLMLQQQLGDMRMLWFTSSPMIPYESQDVAFRQFLPLTLPLQVAFTGCFCRLLLQLVLLTGCFVCSLRKRCHCLSCCCYCCCHFCVVIAIGAALFRMVSSDGVSLCDAGGRLPCCCC